MTPWLPPDGRRTLAMPGSRPSLSSRAVSGEISIGRGHIGPQTLSMGPDIPPDSLAESFQVEDLAIRARLKQLDASLGL